VGPCHHSMERPQVADGGTPAIWRVDVNILNKQSRTADKGWSTSLGVARGANNASPQKLTMLRNISQGLGLGLVLRCATSSGNRCKWKDNIKTDFKEVGWGGMD